MIDKKEQLTAALEAEKQVNVKDVGKAERGIPAFLHIVEKIGMS